ncbi:MAG: thioredoxin domain-containing protein [Nitrososphaeraceae archaeon]|nr:thioredoxin domain-containing protein [Nitrososphaeraceae archaeon]
MISSKIVLTSSLSIIIILMIIGETMPLINAEWKIPSETESKQHVTFENNLLKFDYPYDWKFTETENSVVFYPNSQADDRINITSIDIPNSSISMKSIIDLTLDEFAKNLKDFTLLESNNFPNIKNTNHKLVYSYKDSNDSEIKQADIGFIQGDKLFLLTLISSPQNYYGYLPDFETIISSFNFYNEQKKINQFASQLAIPVAGFVPILGDPQSNITIVEFGDYQCTFCKKFHDETRDLVISNFVNPGKVNVMFKDFIVNDNANDKNSTQAAEASYCAAEQGKYWEYHTEVYDNWAGERTGWINPESLQKFASTVNITNLDKFSDCINSHKYSNLVQINDNIARNLGLTGTPGFVLLKDGEVQSIISGAQPYSIFEQSLNSLLAS